MVRSALAVIALVFVVLASSGVVQAAVPGDVIYLYTNSIWMTGSSPPYYEMSWVASTTLYPYGEPVEAEVTSRIYRDAVLIWQDVVSEADIEVICSGSAWDDSYGDSTYWKQRCTHYGEVYFAGIPGLVDPYYAYEYFSSVDTYTGP